MHSNLPQSPHRDVIERPLPFQAGEGSLYSRAPPVAEYPLTGGNCAITWGYVYRGTRLPSLYGAYVHGEYCSGRIWALSYGGQRVVDNVLLMNSPLQISSFGEDQAGELYILSFDGRIYRLKPPA